MYAHIVLYCKCMYTVSADLPVAGKFFGYKLLYKFTCLPNMECCAEQNIQLVINLIQT